MNEGVVATVVLVFFFVAVPSALVVFRYRLYRNARKQEEEFKTRVAALGLTRLREDPIGLVHRYSFVDAIRQGQGAGSSAKAANVIHGEYGGHWVLIFDYDCFTAQGSGTASRELCLFILEQKNVFPELRIYPKTVGSTLAQLAGYRDVDFQGGQRSTEFAKAYTVRAKDEQFARDVCHDEMMDYLLQQRGPKIGIEGTALTLEFDKHLEPADLERRLEQLVAIGNLLPDYAR